MSLSATGALAWSPPASLRGRRRDLDRAKGLAVLAVVFGHLVAQTPPEGAEWYEPLRYAIYRFHMPFFLYLSGLVMVFSGALATPGAALPGLVRRRAQRLLLPFLAMGLLILGAKLAAMPLAHVDNPPEGLAGGLRDLFWTTEHSPATSVWYLLVLFLCTLVALALRRLGSGALVLLGLALQWPEVPAIAYLDRFAGHFLFFAVGVLVAEHEALLAPAFERWRWPAALAFGGSLWLAVAGWPDLLWPDPAAARLVCGLLAIPALHAAVRRPPVSGWGWPLRLGRYAMAIYLFNTLAIGGAKALLIAAGFGWEARWFPLHLAVGMLAGVGLPVLFKAWALARVPALARATD